MSEEKEQTLIKDIEAAFAFATYPGDENLVTSLEYFDNLNVVINFKSKHWKDISSETVSNHRFDLSRFTPAAFRFYLPAFLIASLQGELRGEIIGHVIHNLIPPNSDPSRLSMFLSQMNGFTPEQKAAITAFMTLYVETETHLLPDELEATKFWETYE